MQTQTHFSFTTRRAAEVAGVEKHVLLTSLQRHGHWRGIVPIKLPTGHLRWNSQAVYEACGLLPATRNTDAESWRKAVCDRVEVDPLAAFKVITCLMGMQALTGPADAAAEARQTLALAASLRGAGAPATAAAAALFTDGQRRSIGGAE